MARRTANSTDPDTTKDSAGANPSTDPDTSKDPAPGAGSPPTDPTPPGAKVDPTPSATTAPSAAGDETIARSMVRLRSRFPAYRVRDTQFTNFTAEVTPEVFEQLRKVPGYGRGMDFFEDVPEPMAANAA